MSLYKTVFAPGAAEPGLDNYECPLRKVISDWEKQNGNRDVTTDELNGCNLTLYRLDIGLTTFTEYLIKGLIQPGGSNLNGLPVGNYAKYAHTLFSPDPIHEGDRVLDQNGTYYAVLNPELWWFGNKFSHFTCELLQLETVTLKTLSYPTLTYTESTIYANMGSQGLTTPFTNYGSLTRSKYTAVTNTAVQEGDIIVDNNDVEYVVSAVSHYPTKRLDGFQWTACALTPIEDATLSTLTLSDYDSVTGLPALGYTESAISIVYAPKGESLIASTAGYYVKYNAQAVTISTVYEGDIITYNSVDYEVKMVQTYPSYRTDGFTWKVCALVKRDFTVYPDTSGTWHLDSTTIKTDPRDRIKTVIDTYLTAANIKKDDGSTNASTHTLFNGATYPVTRLFISDKTLDAAAVISRGTSTTLYTDKLLGRKPYAFDETVYIDIYAVHKSSITASNLLEKYEQEIRRILTTYDAYSSVRDLDSITPEMTDLGYAYLYHTRITVKYKRNNDDYTAALPTITYGDNQGSTYYFPNATEISILDPDTGDVKLFPPGRIGNILQILGMEDFEVTITCDLDAEPAAKTWKRPQATTPKTDAVPFQVFQEIKFGGKTDTDQVYQNLNWGGGTTIPVRLTAISVNDSTLTVSFRRYSASSGSGGTAKQWYGES